MILCANTERMIEASGEITAAVAGSELRHRFTAYRVGNIVGWRHLFALATAAAAFTEASAGQLGLIANAIALGADDASARTFPGFAAEAS